MNTTDKIIESTENSLYLEKTFGSPTYILTRTNDHPTLQRKGKNLALPDELVEELPRLVPENSELHARVFYYQGWTRLTPEQASGLSGAELGSGKMVVECFDLLKWDGEDFSSAPLSERRNQLNQKLVNGNNCRKALVKIVAGYEVETAEDLPGDCYSGEWLVRSADSLPDEGKLISSHRALDHELSFPGEVGWQRNASGESCLNFELPERNFTLTFPAWPEPKQCLLGTRS